MHTPLKQVVRQALSQEWKLNYTEYPAMADFVHTKDKVAIFILDAARYQHGANSLADHHTRISQTYFS
jgi:G:T-mismatch repair DNA endonuclease (very short patch repair protein)